MERSPVGCWPLSVAAPCGLVARRGSLLCGNLPLVPGRACHAACRFGGCREGRRTSAEMANDTAESVRRQSPINQRIQASKRLTWSPIFPRRCALVADAVVPVVWDSARWLGRWLAPGRQLHEHGARLSVPKRHRLKQPCHDENPGNGRLLRYPPSCRCRRGGSASDRHVPRACRVKRDPGRVGQQR